VNMKATDVACAVLAVVLMVMISSYLVPPQPVYVDETEEFEVGGITVDMPSEYVQLPTLRTGLPFRLAMFSGNDSVAEQLAHAVDKPGEDMWYRAYQVSLFVYRNIEYANDPYDMWKLPWETVRDGEGDCEDMAVLAHSMLLALNIDSVLVCTHHHVLLGVNTGEMDGHGVWHYGKWYQLMEVGGIPGFAEYEPYLTMSAGVNVGGLLMFQLYVVLFILLVSAIYGKQTEKERR